MSTKETRQCTTDGDFGWLLESGIPVIMFATELYDSVVSRGDYTPPNPPHTAPNISDGQQDPWPFGGPRSEREQVHRDFMSALRSVMMGDAVIHAPSQATLDELKFNKVVEFCVGIDPGQDIGDALAYAFVKWDKGARKFSSVLRPAMHAPSIEDPLMEDPLMEDQRKVSWSIEKDGDGPKLMRIFVDGKFHHDTVLEPGKLDGEHSHYFRDVKHLDKIDVYRVLDLFGITDQAVGHALKKLLVPGKRGAGKDWSKDIKEAIDTLQRRLRMMDEDGESKTDYEAKSMAANDWHKWLGGAAPVSAGTHVDVKRRDGGIIFRTKARNLNWTHHPHPFSSGNDIVAFRVSR